MLPSNLLADFEADYAWFVFAEELVFPEGGDALISTCAEALAGFVRAFNPGKSFDSRNQLASRFERGEWEDDGVLAGNGNRGKPFRRADEDLAGLRDTEPFGGVIVGSGRRVSWDFAAIAGRRV